VASNVVPLLITEDLIQEAVDLISSSDIVGNNYFKIILGITDEASNQLFHVLDYRKIVGPIDEDSNRKVLMKI